MEYPKWKYSVDKAVTVMNQAEEIALGGGWCNTPTELEKTKKQKIENLEVAERPKKRGRPAKG
jgi:hypothetical protein